MPKEIEIEAKNLLFPNEFEKICKAFSIRESDFQIQTNYYFDTDDFVLKKKKAALRIRKKRNTFELTLKEPNPIGLLETNEKISLEAASNMIKEKTLPKGEVFNRIINLIGRADHLLLLGELTTARAETYYKGGTLVFDKSTYLDKTDYELEYEGVNEEEVEAIFQQLLNNLQIPRRPTKNKVVRFFEYKQKKMHQD